MQEDKERENRIELEILVDSYDSQEHFVSWYDYLGNTLKFPFEGIWKTTEDGKGEKVTIIGMGGFDYCEEALDILVNIEYEGDELFEPLIEIFEIESEDEKTKEAIADWHYWVSLGNSFDEGYLDDDDFDDDDDY